MLCMWRGLKLIRSSRSAEFCDQCNSNTPIGGTGVGLARLGCGIGPTPELGIRINFNLALCKCNLVVRMILGFNHYTMPRSYIGPFLPGLGSNISLEATAFTSWTEAHSQNNYLGLFSSKILEIDIRVLFFIDGAHFLTFASNFMNKMKCHQ